ALPISTCSSCATATSPSSSRATTRLSERLVIRCTTSGSWPAKDASYFRRSNRSTYGCSRADEHAPCVSRRVSGLPTKARLSLAQSSRIPAAAQPLVDPRELTVGMVHLGLGAFHRAHQAVYTERAMRASGTTQWGICAVAQRSRTVLDELEPQDGLYTVVERGPSTAFRVLAPIRELVVAASQADLLTSRIAAPATHVVTVTVTEKGY